MKLWIFSIIIFITFILYAYLYIFVPDNLLMLSNSGLICHQVILEKDTDPFLYSPKNPVNKAKIIDFIKKNIPKTIKCTSIAYKKDECIIMNILSSDKIFKYKSEIEIDLQTDYAFLVQSYTIKGEAEYLNIFSKIYSLNKTLIEGCQQAKLDELHKFLDFIEQNISSLYSKP